AEIVGSLNNLTSLMSDQGNHAGAVKLLEELVANQTQKSPAGSQAMIMTLNQLAMNLLELRRFDEAEARANQALEMAAAVYPAGHSQIGMLMNSLAAVLREERKYDEAVKLSKEALEIFRKAHPEGHTDVADGLNFILDLLEEQILYKEAEPYAHEV